MEHFSSSNGWLLTVCSARSCSGWMPLGAGYYRVHGGGPGLTWLLEGFTTLMDQRGLDGARRDVILVQNPARAFAFATIDGGNAR